MIKFNISEENLKCFINDKRPMTDRKHVSKAYDFSMTDKKKFRETQEDK